MTGKLKTVPAILAMLVIGGLGLEPAPARAEEVPAPARAAGHQENVAVKRISLDVQKADVLEPLIKAARVARVEVLPA